MPISLHNIALLYSKQLSCLWVLIISLLQKVSIKSVLKVFRKIFSNSSLSMEEPMDVVTCYLLRGVILLDLSGIYHIFLKFLPAFISPSWNSSCGVHNVLNKPFSLVSFLSVYVGCSSLRHPLNVEIPPFSFYSVYFLGLSHSLPLIASTIYMFTSPRSIYPEYTFLLSFKLWLSPAVFEIFPTWCSTGPSFLTCLKLN